MTHIIKETNRGSEWLVDVVEFIDNPDALESYLNYVGAPISSNEKGLFLRCSAKKAREWCIKADEAAKPKGDDSPGHQYNLQN